MILRMQLLTPGNALAWAVPGAVLIDRLGAIVTGWELTEPELRCQFEGRDYAYFEVENLGDEWRVIRRVADQDW